MSRKMFYLKPELSGNTRKVNRYVREAIAEACAKWNLDLTPTEDKHTLDGKTYYEFGFRNPAALTEYVVVHYEAKSNEIEILFPVGYRGWDRAGAIERLRVTIYDRLVHGMHGTESIISSTDRPIDGGN